MRIAVVVLVVTLCFYPWCAFPQTQGNSAWVNPFIGASTNTDAAGSYHGLGKTFPGACTPFGMVQLSPNTITGGDNGSGYSYEHKNIEGFAFTQMSGVGWYGDLGNFLVTASNGPLRTSSGKTGAPGYRSAFDKNTEVAKAGYYAVTLKDYGIKAEMTAAPHSGIMKFAFPKGKNSRIQIDLARRVGGTSVTQYIRVVNKYTIEGYMLCNADGGGWGNGDGKPNYTVYFYAQFSAPFDDFGIWSASIPDGVGRKLQDVESEQYQKWVAEAIVNQNLTEKEGKHLGFYAEFPNKSGQEVLFKAGISFTSIDGARKNLEAEIPEWDFEATRNAAISLWDDALGKIKIKGGTKDEKAIFYTALYHTMIDPRSISDLDGAYRGGDGKIYHGAVFNKRSIFSGWDVFRSQFPLQTIINPELVNDMVSSLTSLAEQNGTGIYDRWEFLNAYSGCMVGNPAISVLADAYSKGISAYDIDKAYLFAKNTGVLYGNGARGFSIGSQSISNTLEYAYSDWCMARLAESLGKKEDCLYYSKRATFYKNIFNDSIGWFRPRNEDDTWQKWPEEGILTDWYGTIECNPLQQGWFVPHDTEGLINLLGGKDNATRKLTSFFESTPDDFRWNSYYNHANEPVHHVAFLFNRFGSPWLTQQYSRKICSNAYHNSVEGLVGNDDAGQMSAWYILASIGLYQVCPGDTRYEITSPVFDEIILEVTTHEGKNKSFTIKAKHNSSKNIYIQKAWLNGAPLDKCYIDYNDIINGGKLVLEMGCMPSKMWGLNDQ